MNRRSQTWRKRGMVRPKEKRVPTIVMSRVVGYYAPVRNWNDAKKVEFAERKTYKVPAL